MTLAVALVLVLVLALALTGCAPKDAGVAILTGLDKKELAQGDLPCRSYYEGETLMVPLCEVARALGYSAEWDSANQTAIIDDEYIQKATLTAGSKTTLFEGHLQVINMSREVELAEALAVQEVSADSAVRVRVSPTVTEPIGIVPMEKDFPVATLVDFPISSNQCSDIGEEEDKVLRDSADRTLMPNFIFPFVMLLKRISRY